MLYLMCIGDDVCGPPYELIQVLGKVYPHALEYPQTHRLCRNLERGLTEFLRYTHIC